MNETTTKAGLVKLHSALEAIQELERMGYSERGMVYSEIEDLTFIAEQSGETAKAALLRSLIRLLDAAAVSK